MRSQLLKIFLVIAIGLAPLMALACDCEPGAHAAHMGVAKHDHAHCKEGTCANHKHKSQHKKKSEKEAKKCEPGQSCVEHTQEKQAAVTAPVVSVSLLSFISEAAAPIAFPLLAFVEPADVVPIGVPHAVPLYLLKKSLRP